MSYGLLMTGIIVIAVSAVGWALYSFKKRVEALLALSQRMNFTFSRKSPAGLRKRLEHFHLFSQGRSRKITNVLEGKAGPLSVWLFDYRYRRGGNNNRRTWRQTVLLFEGVEPPLPEFAMRPERLFHKIGQVFGYEDIDFPDHPTFSGRFLLRGRDEGRIRELFQPQVLAHLEGQDRRLSAEGREGQLIYYRARRQLKPEEVEQFIKEGVQLLTLLRS